MQDNYVNMQDKYVNMHLIYVNMQDNYVNMQDVLSIDGNFKPSSLTIPKQIYPPKALRRVIIHFRRLHAP